MSGMAEVLAAHWFSPVDYAYCLCGDDMSPGKPVGIQQTLAAHQAEKLTAAGFGSVKETAAAALEEAADGWQAYIRAMNWGTTRPIDWLRARAAAVRGEG